MRETTLTDPKGKEGEILLSRALCGLRDKGRHCQKTKKFLEFFFKFPIINISASKPNILKTLKWFEETGNLIILNQLDYF
jgi:hypothetical protein